MTIPIIIDKLPAHADSFALLLLYPKTIPMVSKLKKTSRTTEFIVPPKVKDLPVATRTLPIYTRIVSHKKATAYDAKESQMVLYLFMVVPIIHFYAFVDK